MELSAIVWDLLGNLVSSAILLGIGALWARRHKRLIIVDARTWAAFEKIAPTLARKIKDGGAKD